VSIFDDEALFGLSEDGIKPDDGQASRGDEVFEDGA